MMEKAQGQGTTFVHADASNFMEVVQRLTGPHKEHHHPLPPPPPPPPMRSVNGNQGPITTPPTSPKFTGVRKPAFKLHERRQGSRSSLMILKPDTLLHALSPKVLSPPFRPLISPSKGLSQLVLCDKESSTAPESSCLNEAEEEKAIKERRFYLHPSPRSRNSEPELLPLFPLSNTPKSQRST
ncbi:hypothetical protein J5N97_020815 [Dioscorea zingiberensis]|uniref:VQ domain-containing protein n=1 Tax=Dioscorea zingiberensis TaxID=325984 RepID=A0A9D5HDL2_9LILI|nr:hypothetical protein J5N97_020815 [Dioscorea zingiberensis]